MDSLPNAPHDTDVWGERWALLVPYLTLVREDAPQTNAFKELVWCTKRRLRVSGFWIALPVS